MLQKKECASDLAEKAVRKLFKSGVTTPEEIDFILLATQSPDYIMPTTACLLQHRLGIPNKAGALDFNLDVLLIYMDCCWVKVLFTLILQRMFY